MAGLLPARFTSQLNGSLTVVDQVSGCLGTDGRVEGERGTLSYLLLKASSFSCPASFYKYSAPITMNWGGGGGDLP